MYESQEKIKKFPLSVNYRYSSAVCGGNYELLSMKSRRNQAESQYMKLSKRIPGFLFLGALTGCRTKVNSNPAQILWQTRDQLGQLTWRANGEEFILLVRE